MRMLRIAIASISQIFICIDELDKCLPKHRPDLLESLRAIVRESPLRQGYSSPGGPMSEEVFKDTFPG